MIFFVIESKYYFMGKIKDKAISSSIPNTFDFSKMPIMILNLNVKKQIIYKPRKITVCMIYVSCLNFWVFFKKKCKLQELLLLLLCCQFCSFLLLLLWSWQNLWQENSVFRQSLTWWKNPKDCVLAVHGGRPKLQYIKCHPNFLVFLRNYDGGEN